MSLVNPVEIIDSENDRVALPWWFGGALCTAEFGPWREGNVVGSAAPRFGTKRSSRRAFGVASIQVGEEEIVVEHCQHPSWYADVSCAIVMTVCVAACEPTIQTMRLTIQLRGAYVQTFGVG